jgi:hypothetical protein
MDTLGLPFHIAPVRILRTYTKQICTFEVLYNHFHRPSERNIAMRQQTFSLHNHGYLLFGARASPVQSTMSERRTLLHQCVRFVRGLVRI